MHSMDYPPPSIKRPEVGLSLRSRDQLLPLRADIPSFSRLSALRRPPPMCGASSGRSMPYLTFIGRRHDQGNLEDGHVADREPLSTWVLSFLVTAPARSTPRARSAVSTRKNSRAKCLSVNTIDGTWYCHHCGWAGGLSMSGMGYGTRLLHRVATRPAPRVYADPAAASCLALARAGRRVVCPPAAFLESVLVAAGITAGQEWCPQLAHEISWPFVFRTCGWHGWSTSSIAAWSRSFGWSKAPSASCTALMTSGVRTQLRVEGEIDKLSIDAAGGPPTFSVPDGAPSPTPPTTPASSPSWMTWPWHGCAPPPRPHRS